MIKEEYLLGYTLKHKLLQFIRTVKNKPDHIPLSEAHMDSLIAELDKLPELEQREREAFEAAREEFLIDGTTGLSAPKFETVNDYLKQKGGL